MRVKKLAVTIVIPLALAGCDSSVGAKEPPPRQTAMKRQPAVKRHASFERAPTALRPHIVNRASWGADEKMVRSRAVYTPDVRVVFIHHTDQPNDYDCADVPKMLRTIETGHVHRGWDDIGYNFLVDRCGTIYEGRGGGSDVSVKGAHTKGFNNHTVGIAAIGNFDDGNRVPRRMLRSIAGIAAWKLSPRVDPRGMSRLKSDSSLSRFKKGKTALFHAISGHRDAYTTNCPGASLYRELPWLRNAAAHMRETAGS